MIRRWPKVLAIALLLLAASAAAAQQPDSVLTSDDPGGVPADSVPPAEKINSESSPANVLNPEEWRRVEAAVERALKWLAAQQQDDASFPTIDTGQPGVTSLAMMAFVSHGHVPGEGKYGRRLERATDYVLSCQKQNGLLTLQGPDGPRITRDIHFEIGTCAAYNHAISSLMLSEFYGMSRAARAKRMETAINKALAASLEMQRWPKDRTADRGGWRYVHDPPNHPDSDLSITGWNLMFLRSARNAGFNVEREPIDDAVAYVQRCFSDHYGAFQYIGGDSDHRSRGVAGAGILALAHAGFHNSAQAQKTGDWILQHGFDEYNGIVTFNPSWRHDRYHYAVFNCCQGMYQLGGRHWEESFPRIVEVLLENQQPDGSWLTDSHWHDGQFGQVYTTALMVITLGAPNQLLPIFQR